MIARLLILLCLFLLPLSVMAEKKVFDYADFAATPILHEGRVKPLDSFARIHLRRFHGKDSLEGQSANAWLAQVLFDPQQAAKRPLFKVTAKPLIALLELPTRKPALYSYEELAAPLDAQKQALQALAQKNPNSFTAQEKSLWSLYENVSDFAQISRALSLLLPLNLELSEKLKQQLAISEKTETLTYLDLMAENATLRDQLKTIVRKKGEDVARYSPQEQEVALLSFQLTALEITGDGNHLFRVIPSSWSKNNEWFSPWQLMQGGHGGPQTAPLMEKWEKLAQAYHKEDHESWQQLSSAMTQEIHALTGQSPWLIELEIWHNQLNLIPKAAALYALAALCALIALGKTAGRWAHVARWAMTLALVLHGSVILIRMLLLQRPPVSTLYESVLFVAFIAAAYGLWLARKKQLPEGLFIGAILGGGLLAVSGSYAETGDSMGMLIAVLNTNFWLATHVVCITIGYGCALITGTMGHLVLLSTRSAQKIQKYLPFTAVVALLFTAIGTILGGIWADQSWGRFWGWDPKENGALWIVLWLIWLLHSRITGFMDGRAFAALLALTNIIVALSWFGVNLLNVGLHSYGFTDSAAYGLALFCGVELLLIAGLYYGKRNKSQAPLKNQNL